MISAFCIMTEAATRLERMQMRSDRQHSNLACCRTEPPAVSAFESDRSATTIGLVNKCKPGTDEEVTADSLDLSYNHVVIHSAEGGNNGGRGRQTSLKIE